MVIDEGLSLTKLFEVGPTVQGTHDHEAASHRTALLLHDASSTSLSHPVNSGTIRRLSDILSSLHPPQCPMTMILCKIRRKSKYSTG